jgi:glycosyltransferase involved in cell wall biosynthesis
MVSPGQWQHGSFRHVGAWLAEFEFQRYRPRPVLTSILAQYDLVQVVSGTPAWALVARKCGKPVLLQAATLARIERRSKLAGGRGLMGLWRRGMTAITHRLDRAGLRCAAAVFVENAEMEEYARRIGGASRVVAAPPGTDCDFFVPGIYRPDGYLLSVGRFDDPRKNIRLLFTAFSILARLIDEPAPLVLAGAPPSAEDWAYAERLGIRGRIQMLSGVSDEELRALYQRASLFVLSSDQEGFGLVLVEAMACGIPVVSTRCGGAEMAVRDGETGVLTPVGDPHALALAVRDLLLNRDRRAAMREAGRRHAEQRFSFHTAIQPYLATYERVLRST